MECSYDRAIAFALLRLTASHQRIVFSESSYNGNELNLMQILSPIEPLVENGNPRGLSHLENLEKIKHLLSKKQYSEEIFKKVDKKNAGHIDVHDVKEAMQIIGFDFSIKICHGFMSSFDIDRTGFITYKEFEILLENRSVEVDTRIRNLSGQLIMASRSLKVESSPLPTPESAGPRSRVSSIISDTSGLRDESGRRLSCGILDLFIPRYVPPSEGFLYFRVSDFQTVKPLYKVSVYIHIITVFSPIHTFPLSLPLSRFLFLSLILTLSLSLSHADSLFPSFSPSIIIFFFLLLLFIVIILISFFLSLFLPLSVPLSLDL